MEQNDTATAFTAGPWKTVRDNATGNLLHSRDGLAYQVIPEADDSRSIVILVYGDNRVVRAANARLIAAAPNQHLTLTRVVAAIEDMLEDDSLQITSECGDLLLQIASMSNAAIAEARGAS